MSLRWGAPAHRAPLISLDGADATALRADVQENHATCWWPASATRSSTTVPERDPTPSTGVYASEYLLPAAEIPTLRGFEQLDHYYEYLDYNPTAQAGRAEHHHRNYPDSRFMIIGDGRFCCTRSSRPGLYAVGRRDRAAPDLRGAVSWAPGSPASATPTAYRPAPGHPGDHFFAAGGVTTGRPTELI